MTHKRLSARKKQRRVDREMSKADVPQIAIEGGATGPDGSESMGCPVPALEARALLDSFNQRSGSMAERIGQDLAAEA